MTLHVLHAGFDGLRVTVDASLPASVRPQLAKAKEVARDLKSDVIVTLGDMEFAVRPSGNRAFSLHTGELGAEFYIHDPEYPAGQGPAVTVDFRAFLLATSGLGGAQSYFAQCMSALEIAHTDDQMRVSRVDFAVDLLAPWFEPDVDAVILPARTGKREFREKDTGQRFFANTDVTGITCGQVSNRQLVIYDKRAEVLAKRKFGWLEIWNRSLSDEGLPPLDLADKTTSGVWRIENRVGSKCLRRRWGIRSWFDLDAMIGDVFCDGLSKMRYAIPQADRNRSRWPDHELWSLLRDVYADGFSEYRSGVIADDIRTVHRAEHQRRVRQNVLGNLVSLAVSKGVDSKGFWQFSRRELSKLESEFADGEAGMAERFRRSEAKYRFL